MILYGIRLYHVNMLDKFNENPLGYTRVCRTRYSELDPKTPLDV